MAGYLFGCPHCRAKLEARDASRAGRTVTCPQCELSLIIPAPPLMGVSLSQSTNQPPVPAADAASQVVVSSDPGFKRGMSPAKAYTESDGLPAPSSSGYDRLTPRESLPIAEFLTVESPDDIEGYSFTLPKNGTEGDLPPVLKPKKKRSKSDEIEPPHPFEDPKYQLAALVALVVTIVCISGIWSWLSGSGDEKDKVQPAEATAPPAPSSPPGTLGPPPATQGLPGAAPQSPVIEPPSNSTGLPGAAPVATPPTEPAVTTEPAAEPAAVPNALPGAGGGLPGAAPRSPLESPPSELPEATEPNPSPQPAP